MNEHLVEEWQRCVRLGDTTCRCWTPPRGRINVHDHIHGGHEPTPAHINITIQRLQYHADRDDVAGDRRTRPAVDHRRVEPP